MTHLDIVNKLIGPINPVGETNTDNERFENLKQMCDLVDNLLNQIENVPYYNNNAYEFSIKRSVEYSKVFIDQVKDRSSDYSK